MIARHGEPASRITALYGPVKGGFSGGTAASAMVLAELSRDPAIQKILGNPYALDPDPRAPRPPAPDERAIGWNAPLRVFTAPFIMGATNSRVVRRSHALAGLPWGDDFVYREATATPGTVRGLSFAAGMTGGLAALAFALKRPRLRARLAERAPKPGEGPSREAREAGHWRVRMLAERGDVRIVYRVADRGDPGYDSTARMLGESALCLALDPLTSSGGVTTPSIAMGATLIDRLRAVGLEFAFVE
jgi:short subunit dehydrogenase-like uncharacterized protein